MAQAEVITGTANPRAIANLVGLLRLRPDTPEKRSTEIRSDGSVIWRLTHHITVEMWIEDQEFVRWHLDFDDDPVVLTGEAADRAQEIVERRLGA